ncbi:MAG: fructosamine kinase family protein [Betaproteobacteria bacterium]|nr:fructosamine kinase family protein [Betaproteobacteria bacterium]
MLAHELTAGIEAAVVDAVGGRFRIKSMRPVGGGCTGSSFCIAGGEQRYFLKTGHDLRPLFLAEADGLAALRRCDAVAVPQVVALGGVGPSSFLVMTWLELRPTGDESRLGEAVAALHGIEYPGFGWHADNFIGLTPQDNTPHRDWTTFYREQRLLPQLGMAARRGAPELMAAATPLIDALPTLFGGYRPAASLLHGDLWGGNKGFAGKTPCLFDPAVFAGDAETDLAMSELFGGFSPEFYAAYRAVRPLDDGYRMRKPVYQLYHVLNHTNLFGGAYAQQARRLIQSCLAAL